MADFSMTVGGSDVDFDSDLLSPVDLSLSLDGPREFTFTQVGRAHWDPQYEAKEEVVLYDALSGTRTDDNIVFRGKIIEVESDGTPGSERVIYKAYGPRYLAESDVVVRDSNAANSSASGRPYVVYNARRGDPDYDPAREWWTVGDIIKDMFKNNRTALYDAGAVGTETVNEQFAESEVDALTVSPPEPVVFSGVTFTAAIEQLLEYHPDIIFFVNPSTRTWHFWSLDTTETFALINQDIYLSDTGTYQVMEDSIKENIEDCATRIMIHGGLKTEVAEFKLATGDVPDPATNPDDYDDFVENTFEPGWDDSEGGPAEEWSMADSLHRRVYSADPAVADVSETYYSGITIAGDNLSVTISGVNFDANVWKYGWLEFTGADRRIEHRFITAQNTGTGNGTFNFTPALIALSGEAIYSLRLIQPASQSWYVWRRFVIRQPEDYTWTPDDPEPVTQKITLITDPWMAVVGGEFATNITPTVQSEHTFTVTSGTYTVRMNASCEIVEGGTAFITNFPLCAGVAASSSLYPDTGTTNVRWNNGTPVGTSGNDVRPSQVYLTAPRITGSLTAVFPADSGEDPQYTGTANSLYDIEQTRHEYLPEWKNDQQQALFNGLAEEKLKPWKNVRYQGSMNIAEFKEVFSMRGPEDGDREMVSGADRPKAVSIKVNENIALNQSGGAAATTTNWDKLMVKGVTYSWDAHRTPYITTIINIDNNQRPGRVQEDVLFAIQNASTFVEQKWNFDVTKPGHVGTMVIGVDQRIQNPDLGRIPNPVG